MARRHAGLDAYIFLLYIRTIFTALLGYGVYAALVPLSAYVASSFTAPTCSYGPPPPAAPPAAPPLGTDSGGPLDASFAAAAAAAASDNSTNSTECTPLYPPGGLPRTSIANVASWSEDAWWEERGWDKWYPMLASLLGVYLLTGWSCYLLRRAWVRVVFVRQRCMSEARDASSMAVLVRAGPHERAPRTRAQIAAEWEAMLKTRPIWPTNRGSKRLIGRGWPEPGAALSLNLPL